MTAGPDLLSGSGGRRAVAQPGPESRPAAARVLLAAGRAEAGRLCRNPLLLASALIFAGLVWWNSRPGWVPQWWVWDVQIGSTMLAVAAATLVAVHLAAGRVRRDGAEMLYESFPASPALRTGAFLLGVTGPVLIGAVLAVGAVAWVDRGGPVGAPRLAVLAGALLLVALGGAVGAALGTWLPHPMTGLLAVIVLGAAEADLLLPWSSPVQLPGTTPWLFPWTQPVVIHFLPGPSASIPPTAHLPWLAALTGLAALTALARSARRSSAPDSRSRRHAGARRPRPGQPARYRSAGGRAGLAALATAACLVLAGWSGWSLTRPVPAAAQDQLLGQLIHPAKVERCVRRDGVSYCAYPAYLTDVPRWAEAVSGVLRHLPARPSRPLVVRQLEDWVDIFAFQPYAAGVPVLQLYQTRRARQVIDFFNAVASTPSPVPGSSVPPVYVGLGWGAGASLGPYQLGLAIGVARWVADLPTTFGQAAVLGTAPVGGPECLAVGQAREAVALWLAGSAVPRGRAMLDEVFRFGYAAYWVAGRWVQYTGVLPLGLQSVPPNESQGFRFTKQGWQLAREMLRLPSRRVEAVLAARWPGWLSPGATDAQLAAALGVAQPILLRPSPGKHLPVAPVCR